LTVRRGNGITDGSKTLDLIPAGGDWPGIVEIRLCGPAEKLFQIRL